MAVNVVIALYYYLTWTARLFGAPSADSAASTGSTGSTRAGLGGPTPVPLRLAIGLTLAAAVVLSVWPQPALGALGGF
jgi:NADH-quinone oxidoreductase subunit N